MNQVTVSKTTAPKGQSLWYLARRRLLRNKAAVLSLIILFLLTVCAFAAPHL